MKRILLITFFTSCLGLALSLLAGTQNNSKNSTEKTTFPEQSTVAADIKISSGI